MNRFLMWWVWPDYAAWKGLRHGPKEVMDRLYQGEIVDPGAYNFRTTPYFETSSEKYGWMNRICSIASGSFSAEASTVARISPRNKRIGAPNQRKVYCQR